MIEHEWKWGVGGKLLSNAGSRWLIVKSTIVHLVKLRTKVGKILTGRVMNGDLESACISRQQLGFYLVTNVRSVGSHFQALEVAGYADILPLFDESSDASTCISGTDTSMWMTYTWWSRTCRRNQKQALHWLQYLGRRRMRCAETSNPGGRHKLLPELSWVHKNDW